MLRTTIFSLVLLLALLPVVMIGGSATAQENVDTKKSVVAPAGTLPARLPTGILGTLKGTLAAGASHTGGTATIQLTPGGEPGVGAFGFGQASVPAESATIKFTVSKRREGSITTSDLNPIIAVLIANGVRQQDIQTNILSPYSCEPDSAEVRVNVPGVSQQRILQIVTAIIQATCEPGFPVSVSEYSIGVMYSISDCEPVIQRALQAAINDARNRAQRLATALNVQLGSMQLADDFSANFAIGSQCSQSRDSQLSEFYQFVGPSAPAEVVVQASVQLAFAFQ